MERNDKLASVLRQLACGELDPDEWIGWWEQNSNWLASVLSRGQFLRLKPYGLGRFSSIRVLKSQSTACDMLDEWGVDYEYSDRYEQEAESQLNEWDPPYDELLEELQIFIDRPREGWLLTPEAAAEPLRLTDSKFGGSPYTGDLGAWPRCPECEMPLNFIIQLEKSQFPQMWFPRAKNLFQVFRCPNFSCQYGNGSDHYLLILYVQTRTEESSPLVYPEDQTARRQRYDEKPIPEHTMSVQRIDDYPSGYSGRRAWWGDLWVAFQDRYTTKDPLQDEWFYHAEFWNFIRNAEGMKIAGLPSWLQHGYPPECQCGRTKEFIFQLSSIQHPNGQQFFSIGDGGNIYFFVCVECSEESLETCWDCG